MSLDVVRELSADQPHGHVSGRQIRDRPRNARHLLRIGHLELGGGGRMKVKSEKWKVERQARSNASSLVPQDLQNFASSSFTVAQDGQTPVERRLPSALLLLCSSDSVTAALSASASSALPPALTSRVASSRSISSR